MSGVSTDNDVRTQDVVAIMDGGQNFIARMTVLQDSKKALEEARAAHDKALTELRLGQEARAVLDHAEQTLAVAKAEGIRLLNEARGQANKITNDARAVTEAAQHYAQDQKAAVAARVMASDREASGRLAVAKQEHAAAAGLRTAAEKLKDELAKMKTELAGKQATLDAERGELHRKLTVLREALNKVG